MEKLIALIVVTVIAGGGSIAGYQQIRAAADRQAAESNVVRVVNAARVHGNFVELNGGYQNLHDSLKAAVDSLDLGAETVLIEGGLIRVTFGNACFQAVLTDLDSPAVYSDCSNEEH